MAAPGTSIVIVAHGRRDVTERCLDSLQRCLGPSLGDTIELVLVDNDSPDDTRTLFERWRDRATIVLLGENRNFAGGCNAGAAAAAGELLIFLNNDTIAEPGMLEGLAEEISAPGAGVAGLRLLYLDGTLQHAGVAMIRVPSGVPVPHHLFHHQDGWLPAARAGYELDVVTGACLAIRADLFTELGGFDEGYVNGWEDVDLCLRVRMTGRAVVYRGDLWLWHDEGQTRGVVRGVDGNARRFYDRWGSLLDSDEELIERVFGARLPVARPCPPVHGDAGVVVEAMVRGTGPTGAEARGLLAALDAVGLPAAAREPVPEMVLAGLPDGQILDLERALVRNATPDATTIRVSAGSSRGAGGILRLARVPDGLLAPERHVWAASPGLRDALIAAGARPSKVEWVAPCVPTGPAGPGGGGVLCVLPAHDLRAARAAAEALAAVGAASVRLLVTARAPRLVALVERLLPTAELVGLCADEERVRELALIADVFLSADPADTFERLSLTAAGTGAAVLTTSLGPAGAVLGEQAVTFDAISVAGLTDALERGLAARAGARAARAERIAAACSTVACGRRVAALLAPTAVSTVAAA